MHTIRCLGGTYDIPAVLGVQEGVTQQALATGVPATIVTKRSAGLGVTCDTSVVIQQLQAGGDTHVYCLGPGVHVIILDRDGTSLLATFTGTTCRVWAHSIEAMKQAAESP